MSTLTDLFERLSPPPDTGQLTFSAVPIPRHEQHRLAKDVEGAPCLLLCVQDVAPRPAPIRLEHLSVEHNAHCTVYTTDGESVGRFTILRCQNASSPLRELFLCLAEPLLYDLREHPTPTDIHRVVTALVELFRAAATPGRKTVQGLWAELFVIASADCPNILIQAWHTAPEDRYDFANGPKRIEVKSSGTRVRQHRFSLEQLTPTPGTRVIVASLFAEQSAGGASIDDLLTRIVSIVDAAALQAHLQRITYLALGNTWLEAMTAKFDTEVAAASLRFVDATAVPSLTGPVPPGVTRVRFCSDLSASPTVSTDELVRAGGLFAAVRPRPMRR